MYLDEEGEYLYTLNPANDWGSIMKMNVDERYKL